MQTAQRYSHVTQEDLDVLDMLSVQTPTTHSSTLAHHLANGSSSSSSSHQHTLPTDPPFFHGKRRPLATIAALRRPPIDPIILAASLSSGPQVTRHHFHHSYGADPRVKAPVSEQMPASQRKARALQQQQQGQQERHDNVSRSSQQPNASRTRPRAGSYANCDVDPPLELGTSGSSTSLPRTKEGVEGLEIEPVPEVTAEELASYYASQQAPRSVRLKREEEAKRAQAAQIMAAVSKDASPVESLQQQPRRPQFQKQPSRAAEELSAALSERQAVTASNQQASSAPVTASSLTIDPASASSANMPAPRIGSIVRPPPLHVRCYARTRVPTPHGEVFCHLYRNNHDAKEHLALVVDPAQNDDASMILGADGRPTPQPGLPPPLRSRTLDEVWGPHETEMERIVRGAYVGRLGPSFQMASEASQRTSTHHDEDEDEVEAPLVRIHSECYTGETIGSQRCDCGEQLDEAIRLISETGHAASAQGPARSARGVVVYLRQEGRGIGLLDKLMAYNLQDMGHDTVAANILLGHLPDARKYDVASAILNDLGIEQCRLLTNNPEKMEALEAEGVHVRERVAMVPRVWRCGARGTGKGRHHKKRKDRKDAAKITGVVDQAHPATKRHIKVPRRLAELAASNGGLSLEHSIMSQPESRGDSEDDAVVSSDPWIRSAHAAAEANADAHLTQSDSEDEDEDSPYESDSSRDSYVAQILRRSGATMVGAGVTRGPELEKYLRTKVERMGHMLTLPPDAEAEAATASDRVKREERGGRVQRPAAERQHTATSIDTQPALDEDGEVDEDEEHIVL